MFGWLKNIRTNEPQRRTLRMVHAPMRVRGRYDAAVTTDENRRHWANADLLSANAANNPQVRRTLRSRSRYEVANNSYARGIVLTLANDCVGTGPRLQMAVLAAAETAADFAAVLYTDAPANGEADTVEPMDLIELERRMATVLPGGWRLGQIQAQQPSTTYAEFKKEILNEIARCLNMPFNVACGNSSGYNYASGRLDHQVYYKSIRVDQAHMGISVLDRVLRAWLDEAILISDFLPIWLRTATFRDLTHQWFWDGQEHVDPAKEANAQATRLQNHTTTLAYEYARQGRDWEGELRQRAKEVALMRKLELPLTQGQPVATTVNHETNDEQEEA